jgi:hypothetical protein
VEQRETPVHVWISAPEVGARGGSVPALVYVGAQKAVDGTLQFPSGVSTVVLPTLYMNAGPRLVQAVFWGGQVTLTEEVKVAGETWIHVTLSARSATIKTDDEQPRVPR